MSDKDVRARIRVGANSDEAYTITMDNHDVGITSHQFPAKEWCILDDVLNVADSASVSIANIEGENTGKFSIGQRIEIDESDPDVAQGQWIRHFTGRITALNSYSDIQGGTNILITAMDLGWHLTSSHGKPLQNLNGITWNALLNKLIDSSWGFGTTVGDNKLNRHLKQGRTGAQRSLLGLTATLTSILPYIQIEPGQSPWDIIQVYAQREGVLVNVSAKGELVFFRPDYKQEASYNLEFHTDNTSSQKNNVVGRPSLSETIDGLYSEVQCWSTIVNPQKVANPEDPNAAYTHYTFTPSQNPLPFSRRQVITDSESISNQMRQNRATWKQQSGQFESWQYEAEFKGHSAKDTAGNGHYYTSDTIISMNDTIHDVVGGYYVQRVSRSSTLENGLRSKLLIRKPGLLNPALTTFDLGASTKRPATTGKPKA